VTQTAEAAQAVEAPVDALAPAGTRFLLTIQYLGTQYAGWQTQTNAVGVQQVIEKVLEMRFGKPLTLQSAGRTDSGVHACAHRAHVDIPSAVTRRSLVLGLNNALPRDIRITEAEPVPGNFHARFDAISKRYRYQILNDSVANVFLAATHLHVAQELDVDVMSRAARDLVGLHDFRSFTVAAPEVSSTVRNLSELHIEKSDRRITIDVTADGFLRYMVRRIAGLLIEIGRGKLPETALADALGPKFQEARWTAAAHGLTLEEVIYDRDESAYLRPLQGTRRNPD